MGCYRSSSHSCPSLISCVYYSQATSFGVDICRPCGRCGWCFFFFSSTVVCFKSCHLPLTVIPRSVLFSGSPVSPFSPAGPAIRPEATAVVCWCWLPPRQNQAKLHSGSEEEALHAAGCRALLIPPELRLQVKLSGEAGTGTPAVVKVEVFSGKPA